MTAAATWEPTDRRFLRIAIAYIVIAVAYLPTISAMDWETASEVAFCRNRAGYERDAGRVLDILKAHEIYGKIIYFKRINGVDAVMEDTSQADKFGVFVNAKNAGPAKKVLAEEIKKGLRITLSPCGY